MVTPASSSVSRLLGAAVSVLALTLVACGSDGGDASPDDGDANGGADSGPPPSKSFLACPEGTDFHLVGEVDGESVDLTEAPTTGGFSQQSNPPGPHFQIPSETAAEDPELVAVFLTWSGVIASGEIASTEGTVRFPADGPLAGETICAGAGSEVTLPLPADKPSMGNLQFRLRDVRRGADCSSPVSGELKGCWRN